MDIFVSNMNDNEIDKHNKQHAIVIGGSIAGLLAAAPASAQLSGSGGPIDITANELELIDAQRLAIWRGDVEALQGGNRMRAEQINIYFSGSGGASAGAPGRNWGPVTRIEATGTVYFVTPQQTARGDRGVVGQGPLGSIRASSYAIGDRGRSIVFKGDVHARIEQDGGE